jgi:hypothetical protein
MAGSGRNRFLRPLLLLGGMILSPAATALDCDLRSILERSLTEERPLDLDLTPKPAELRALDRTILREIEQGTPYSYAIDTLDQIHFIRAKSPPSSSNGFLALKRPGEEGVRVMKESGTVRFDPKTKRFTFEPTQGWDLTPGEGEELIKRIEKDSPGIRIERKKNPKIDRATTFNCLDILSKSKSGKSFLLDNLISSNTVAAAGIVTQELSGNHLLTDPEKRQLMYADLIANNLSTLVTSPIIKRVVVSDMGPVRDFATRTTTDYLTNVFVKKPIYNAMSGESEEDESPEKKSTGTKLVPYDTGFSVIRFYPKRVLDRALMNKIPEMLVSACLDGNELAASVGPKMIRIADRYTWGLIYLGGRNQYLQMTE